MKENQEKPLTVRNLFVERMRREGRGKEWSAAVKQVMQETGQRFGQASWEAMRRMGYVSPKKERQLHQTFLEKGQKSKLRQQIDREREEIREEQEAENFDLALRRLPDHAPVSAEIDWVRTHPAMMRRTRHAWGLKDVMVTPDDILRAPNGMPPSKGAVFALQHWVNHPKEFYNEVLSQQIKDWHDPGSDRCNSDPGIADIERLLQQVQSREKDPGELDED